MVIVKTIVENAGGALVHETLKGVWKMGEVRINLSNFVVIGLMAFLAVWLINKGLVAAKLPQYTTSATGQSA